MTAEQLFDSPLLTWSDRKEAMVEAARACGANKENFVSVVHAKAWAEYHNKKMQLLRCVNQGNENET